MDECELISFITAIACAISKNCSEDEISILAVVFTQLGDTLGTVLAKRSLAAKNESKKSETEDMGNSGSQINHLQNTDR